MTVVGWSGTVWFEFGLNRDRHDESSIEPEAGNSDAEQVPRRRIRLLENAPKGRKRRA